MPAEITMPKLGLTMESGTIVRWLKAPGERIAPGDPLLEVSTDKINYEVESPVGGTFAQRIGNDGDEFACGALIGLVALDNENVAVAASASPVSVSAPRSGSSTNAQPGNGSSTSGQSGNGSSTSARSGNGSSGNGNGQRTLASPAARKLAREHRLDVGTLHGSGPRGRVTRADVLAQAGSAPAATAGSPAQSSPANGASPAVSGTPPPELEASRRTIFRRMSEVGVLPLAQVETVVRADAVHALIARRKDFGWTAFAVYALGRILRDHPGLRIDARSGKPATALDIGVAADTPRGLVVPVVRGADSLGLAAIQTEILRLATSARAGALAPADAGGAAFSLSNVGPQGVERVSPLVDPPQTAILGMGAATRRPAVEGDAIVPAWMVTLVLTFDHRFVDGAPAARFLAALAAAFADPGLLL
jgi:pyruvate/2-oxoglutarate dehydrogenase complex dihydrolipoamide acyltransferase (E2) component